MRRMKGPAPLEPAASAENPARYRILREAVKAFMRNGYAGTSTLDIATRAKVSKRDLYANFSNKQALLVACIANRAARMRLSPDLAAPRNRESLASTLTTFGATVLREVSDPAVLAMFRLSIAEATRSPEVAQTLERSRSVNRGSLSKLLARAQSSGILGRGDPQQMMEQFLALLWGDLMVSLLLNVASRPHSAEINKRAQAATEAFLEINAASMSESR